MTTLGETKVIAGADLTAEQLHELLALRIAVFVVEQACAYHETDGRDLLATTRHIWREDNEGVAVAVRVLDVGAEITQIGRVVTRADSRGNGLAGPLVELAHDRYKGPGGTILGAQLHLAGWYEHLGWKRAGDPYAEDGIEHIDMRRSG